MSSVDDLRQKLVNPDSVPLSDAEIAALRAEFPGIPENYLEFLSKIGYGCLGGVHVYRGPIPAAEIYEGTGFDFPGIFLVADDGQGNCWGFDTLRNYHFVEISSLDDHAHYSNVNLTDIIAAYCS